VIRGRLGRGALVGAAVTAMAAVWGCQRHAPAVAATPAPDITTVVETRAPATVSVTHVVDSSVTSGSTTTGFAAPVMTSASGGPEPLISMHFPTPVDVRIPLRMIAAMGHYGLVVPPEVTKKLTVSLDSVPVSLALKVVLQDAGLALVPSQTARAKLPYDTTVVFYQLPVNVDSLSVEGLMKRFGVSRDLAEMLVLSRRGPGG
jgi:hypothetical protein